MRKTSAPRLGNQWKSWTDVALDSNGKVIAYVHYL